MTELPMIVITVLLTLVVERCYSVPRDIRQNNERIQNRDEDLRCWLEETRMQVRRDHLRIWAREAPETDGYDYSVSECSKVKKDALQRYQEQLREAERAIREVQLSEQLPHRAFRKVRGDAIPGLVPPSERTATIIEWEKSPEEDLKEAEEARVVGEQRRAAAGRPPLRPLQLAEIV
jgi:hypothetical protein